MKVCEYCGARKSRLAEHECDRRARELAKDITRKQALKKRVEAVVTAVVDLIEELKKS